MAAAWADTGTVGWFCAGTRAGVFARAWVSTCTVAEPETGAGAATGDGTVGATVKSRPAAVVSASTPLPQREV